ncbi:MAG: flagellar protein FlgN [Clostridiaceae bacterium]|nr:flagellar protein FlgN [Clostridiaceae bacterium]
MASLMEELIDTLEKEREIYEKLIPVSEKKTGILVRDNLSELEEVTMQEQQLIDQANLLGKKREEVIANIAVVLNKDADTLDLGTLAALMEKQPEERKKLAALHDSLKTVMKQLVEINVKNKNLIENSLEMIEFNMNFIQSTRMSPGVNNYNKNASTSYDTGYSAGAFDAKQ